VYQLDYKTLLERTCLILGSSSFLTISFFLAFVDPSSQSYYFWVFLACFWLLIYSIIFLLNLWWINKILKKFINNDLLNHLLLRTTGLACAISFVYFLNLAESLNIYSFFVCVLLIFLYIFWMS
jgi:hypothetical protein